MMSDAPRAGIYLWRGQHSWHVLVNSAFLVTHEARGIGADTRALP